MAGCSHYSTDVPIGARFCPGCGTSQGSVSQMPTELAAHSGAGAPARTPGPQGSLSPTLGRLDASGSFGGGVFLYEIYTGRRGRDPLTADGRRRGQRGRASLLFVLLPFTLTSPYAFQTFITLLVPLVLIAWAFKVSLGGRPAFALLLDD